jgi:ABC-2 type transport system ATP-binding protein
MALAIKTEKLTKKFGKFTAVNKLDIEIETGEMYGLLGPNGSGKTTFIKLLVGLLRPTSGRAKVFGRTIPDKSIMPKIGYMPQESAIYIDNTVHENLLLFGEIYGLPSERIAKREGELLTFVDLKDWRNALVSTLSGGMKHRLSLACALVHEPKLLFLDEPTVGVDPELRATFWDYFKALRERGATVIITTHYIDEADHCSRVGLLRQGRLIADNEPSTLKRETGTESLEDAFLKLARRDGK